MATGTNNRIPLSDESMPHTCQNKLVKFRLDILSGSREIEGSFSWGADSPPPLPGEIGLNTARYILDLGVGLSDWIFPSCDFRYLK